MNVYPASSTMTDCADDNGLRALEPQHIPVDASECKPGRIGDVFTTGAALVRTRQSTTLGPISWSMAASPNTIRSIRMYWAQISWDIRQDCQEIKIPP